MKRLLGIIFIAGLFVPVLAQRSESQLFTADAPSLRIFSAPFKLDRAKRHVKLWLEIKNVSDQTIKEFTWQYRTQGVIQDYNFSSTANMLPVSLVLQPGARKKVMLIEDSNVPEVFWDLPVRELRIVSVTFQDGSDWNRKKPD